MIELLGPESESDQESMPDIDTHDEGKNESDSNDSFLDQSPSTEDRGSVTLTCVQCTIHDVSQRLSTLEVTWSHVQQMSCNTSCLTMDLLGDFADSFVSFLSKSVITYDILENVKDELCSVLNTLSIGTFQDIV